MRTLTFYILLTCAIPQFGTAQITGNINVKDPNAIEITESVRALLCRTNWFLNKTIEVRRGTTELTDRSDYMSHDTHKFETTGIYDVYGKWEIINNQYLSLSTSTKNTRLVGSYSIYEINDSILVLGRILTSTGDWRKEFHFKNKVVSKDTSPVEFQPVNEKLANEIKRTSFYDGVTWPYLQEELKNGQEILRYPNGTVSHVRYHELKPYDKEELFLYNLKLDTVGGKVINLTNKDTRKPYWSVPTGKWIHYNTNGTMASTMTHVSNAEHIHEEYFYRAGVLEYIKRTDFLKDISYFLTPGADSVTFDIAEIDEIRPIGTSIVTIMVRNLTNHPIRITTVNNKTYKVVAKEFLLNPTDSLTQIDIELNIPEMRTSDTLLISSDRWTFRRHVKTLGYHITEGNFNEGGKITLPLKFLFFKSGPEFQMEIKGVGKNKFSKSYPVSKMICEFVLKKGDYQMTLVSPTGSKTKNISVK